MDAKKVFELDLHGKKLSRIEGLDKFKHLRSLDASCNKITKISGLETNKDLRELKLYGNEITVIEGLDRLCELCTLLLQHNNISHIGNGLSNLKKLRQLRLDHNCLVTISHSDLTSCGGHMTHLDLSHNQLTSLQGLGSLSNIEELNLASNKLTSPPDLSRCKKLQELDLSENPLSMDSLSSLKSLTQLKALHLNQVNLTDLSSLPKLVSLETLHLSRNQLNALREVARLFPRLEILDVSWNCLASLESLRSLEKLESLSEVQLEGNDVCQSSNNYRRDIHNVVPRLEVIDGVAVSIFTSTLPQPLQMRPLTPSSVGPTLRQMEQHFLEAELQLQGLEGEMAARFELTRAKMAATVRERSEEIYRQSTEVVLRKGHDQNGQTEMHRPGSGDQPVRVGLTSSTEMHRPGSGDQPVKAGLTSSPESVVRIDDSAGRTHAGTKCGPTSSRPATRSGSRTKLTEALAFAALYSDQSTCD